MELKTKIIELDLGRRNIKLKLVNNLDELLNQVTEVEDIPFWAELWPSALALARWLTQKDILRGLTVLELGTGLGLSGLAASLAGATVLQTDMVAQSLELAGENGQMNSAQNLTQRVADWRDFRVEESFDVIIGSDILYEPKLNTFLTDIFARSLKPDGRVILADPGRQYGREYIQALQDQGWHLVRDEEEVDYDGKIYLIDIYTLYLV